MSLERDFLEFTPGPSFYERERVRVTINTKGEIYMNRKAFAELGKPEAVKLYYSPPRQTIAIEPATARDVKSFTLRQRQPGVGGHYVSAARLFRHHRVVVKNSEAFTHPEINSEGIMLLNLQETTRVGGWTIDGSDGDAKREEQRLLREERLAAREQKQLARAQEQEKLARAREQEKHRREIDKKNALEVARRERIAAARERSRDTSGTDPDPDEQPKRKYRAMGF